MQRQGIVTSPKQLRRIAQKLEKEMDDEWGKGNWDKESIDKFLVNIVNKTKESDTWTFEDGVDKQG